MLSNISWEQFLLGVGLFTAIYYAFVIVRFFPAQLKWKMARKHSHAIATDEQDGGEFYADQLDAGTEEPDGYQDEEMQRTEQLVAELKESIKGSGEFAGSVDEVKLAVSAVLRGYPDLRYSYVREAITLLIVNEVQKTLSVTISDEEAEGLWD